MNQTFRINKNWSISIVREANNSRRKPYLEVSGEFSKRKDVVDLPIHYNTPATQFSSDIAYDNGYLIPEFVKRKVRELYKKFPECKCPND